MPAERKRILRTLVFITKLKAKCLKQREINLVVENL